MKRTLVFISLLLALVLTAQVLQNGSTGTTTSGTIPSSSLPNPLTATAVTAGSLTVSNPDNSIWIMSTNGRGTNVTIDGFTATNSTPGAAIITANGTNGIATLNSAGNWKVAALGSATEVNYGVRGNKTNGLYIAADNAVAIANNGTNAATWQDGNQTNAGIIKANGGFVGSGALLASIQEAGLALTDVTTANVTTSAHGFAPKGTAGTTQFWRQDWTLATPSGGSVSPTTLTQTNFVLNSVYTNGSQSALLKAVAALTTAAVNGDASLDLMADQAGGTSFALIARNGIGTTVAVTLAMTYTNSMVGVVAPSATYYWTNSSAGAGNSSVIVAGTGQIATISSGTNGATGATGATGPQGPTDPNAITNNNTGNVTILGSVASSNQFNSLLYGAGNGDVPVTIYRSSTVVNDTGSSSLSNVVSFTIPGNSLSTNKSVRVWIAGDIFQNSGSSTNITLGFVYGATTNWAFHIGIPVSASGTLRRPFFFDITLSAVNSTASQLLTGTTRLNVNNSTPDSGEGNPSSSDPGWAGSILGTSSEDSTANKTFSMYAIWASASSSCEFKVQRVSAILQ